MSWAKVLKRMSKQSSATEIHKLGRFPLYSLSGKCVSLAFNPHINNEADTSQHVIRCPTAIA